MEDAEARSRSTILRKTYDAVIVGSGAGGGMSAYVLTQAGLNVLILEAGRDYDPTTETAMFDLPEKAPLHGAATPDKPYGYYEGLIGGYQLPDEPYTVADGSTFSWRRARMLGGRTNHWRRLSLRFGPYDFKGYSRDGLGADWPITYDDLAPWYDKVEQLIGVTGTAHGLENIPDSPPGIHLPPPPLSAGEYFIKRGIESMGMPVAAVRAAVLTQPLNGRPQCLYATSCGRGCSIGASFQTPTVLLPLARKTKKLAIYTHAAVYRVETDKSGRATGVSFIDRLTNKNHFVRAKTVVLAASAFESARILLNSKSQSAPQGLANESGMVGRDIVDHMALGLTAQFPALERLPPGNDDGISISHFYVPWWGYGQQARKELDFPRGYHIQVSGGRQMPEIYYAAFHETSHGSKLREEIRHKYGSFFTFIGAGEMIPNADSFLELDPDQKDKWGIPVLRIHFKRGDTELRQADHMHKTISQIIDRLGGKTVANSKFVVDGGGANHEVGGTRMGSSPKDSVVNQFGQAWNIKDLFIVDGGVFASSPDKNPTLTILALSWRNSAYLAEEARKGNL